MEPNSTYVFLITVSLLIILSYLYNLLAQKTNIPSVLMLILTGIGLAELVKATEFRVPELFPILEVLGTVGLIMIVLEAALDLKLTKDKTPIILKSFLTGLAGLVISAVAIAFVIQFFNDAPFGRALLYATPMAILSSAIIIPSVHGMRHDDKEFMIYESTFSDILGIMLFYAIEEGFKVSSGAELLGGFTGRVAITILFSLLISYGLVLLFQNIKTQVRLFLLIAVLILLYSIGKLEHLSSLLIILVFGLVLNNYKLFFRGRMKKWIKPDAVVEMGEAFHLITLESAFIVRTLFFIVFGMTIDLVSLLEIGVFLKSMIIIGIIYLIRYLVLKLIKKRSFEHLAFIAPRGLITILLFFAIPDAYTIPTFESGVLLYVIIISAILMTVSLIQDAKRREAEAVLAPIEPEKILKDEPED